MPDSRDLALLSGRIVLGGYLAAHGAQKLFGSFDGYGIEATSAGFDSLGLKPGAFFARVAGVSELAGGALVALWVAGPGRLSFDRLTGFRLPRSMRRVVVAGAVVSSGVSLAMVARARKHTTDQADETASASSPSDSASAGSSEGDGS